jgi:putative ABC transport system permease protein
MSAVQPLRISLRSLRRTPVFSAVVVLTLVIAVGATTAIFAVLNGVLLKPLPYGNPDRLIAVWHDLPGVSIPKAQQTQGTYFTYQKFAHTIEGIGVYQTGSVNVSDITHSTDPQRITGAYITQTLLPVLQVRPMLGRNFTEEEDSPAKLYPVIISEGMWRRRFGADPAALGRSIEVNGHARQIVGIMPASFRFPSAETQLWLPMGFDPNKAYPGGFSYDAVARLKPGVSVADAQRDFKAVLPRLVELYPQMAPGVSSQQLLDKAQPIPLLIPLREDMTSDIAKTLWMVGAAALLVLLVACANVSNLMLVRADARQRELAVREALGAGGARIMSYFFAEAAILAGVAGVLGVLAAWASVRALVAAGPIEIPRLAEVHVDPTTIVFAILVSAFIAFVCSVIPALRIGRAKLSLALREGGRAGTAGKVQQRVRGGLVAAQIALALVVLAGSGLLVRTFQRLTAIKPGYDASSVSTMWVSLRGGRYEGNDTLVMHFFSDITQRVAALPGVTAVGVTSHLPLMDNGQDIEPFFHEGETLAGGKIPPLEMHITVDSGYFRAMRIPLIAGRNFIGLESQAEYEAIINRASAIEYFHDSTGVAAIGKRFTPLPSGPLYTIIGVVGETRDTSLAAPPERIAYFAEHVGNAKDIEDQFQHTLAIVTRTASDPATIAPAVQRAIHELDPSLPVFQVRTMAEVVKASTARLSFIILILGAAAAVTLLLGAVGLYGVMAYVVTLRTKELGVRIALGAQPRAVAAMMTKQGLVLTSIGVVAGLALFTVAARFLRAFLFDTAPTDPVALSGAAIVLLAVAILASVVPAMRAARVDPVEALRAE